MKIFDDLDSLIESAENEFLKYGFKDASMRRISVASGVSTNSGRNVLLKNKSIAKTNKSEEKLHERQKVKCDVKVDEDCRKA